jgi:hypothetical protein
MEARNRKKTAVRSEAVAEDEGKKKAHRLLLKFGASRPSLSTSLSKLTTDCGPR